jgi:serine/threonine-protein kinase
VVQEIDERERHSSEARILPLRFKWTAVMAVVVCVAMILGSYLVYHKQVEAMMELALDSGGSLAQFIAIESVESLLIEDWVALESFVQGVEERQQISYLHISDHQQVVRASTTTEEVGQPLVEDRVGTLLRGAEDILISVRERDDVEVFEFKVPLLFQDKLIGTLQLGISRDALNSAANLTFYTMLLLLVVVVVTVAVVAYLLAARITLPIRILRSALAHVWQGNLNHRIKAERNDEFGLLFGEYNRMAEMLLQTQEARYRELAEARHQAPQTGPAVLEERQPEHTQTDLEQRFEAKSESLHNEETRILQPKAKPSGLSGS